MSIDTEGSEIAIIESISQDYWTQFIKSVSVDVSTIKGDEEKAKNSARLLTVFEDLGFERVEQLKHDDIFINKQFFGSRT